MMNKLRTICVTMLLALALCAPALAGDGQMGTGGPGPKTGQMGTGAPLTTQSAPTDDESAPTINDILLAAELAIWQSIIGQL